jgi:peptidoglycan/xylan/chitin deacetylase (PgdA/CDA1 family)
LTALCLLLAACGEGEDRSGAPTVPAQGGTAIPTATTPAAASPAGQAPATAATPRVATPATAATPTVPATGVGGDATMSASPAASPLASPLVAPVASPVTASAASPVAMPVASPLVAVVTADEAAEITTEATPVESPVTPVATLTRRELDRHRPNELGVIPVLEYHTITTKASEEGPYSRTYKNLERDLQWLYEHDFYVVSLREIVENRITAPAGKRPVALTFDDSLVTQFRIKTREDGSRYVDPKTAVGVLETFYDAHPDFGRGGAFAVVTDRCFDWTTMPKLAFEEEQTPLCETKIAWLLSHGFEVINHTVTHANLGDVSTEEFMEEVGGAYLTLKGMDPRTSPDLLVLPYGAYPKDSGNEEQMAMLRDGFTYQEERIEVSAGFMVGAEPAFSPSSTEWDPLYIARIQAHSAEEYGYTGFWFAEMAASPELLYVSDGNPETITVPKELPEGLAGTLDKERLEREGRTVRRYTPED